MRGPSSAPHPPEPAPSMANLHRILGRIVEPGNPPPEVDLPFYRTVHDDLSGMDDATLSAHFEAHGRSEGRIASPAAHRDGLLGVVPRDEPLLEIGPFTKPVFRGANVSYFDVLDRRGLVARAREHGMPTENCPDIHFVSPTGDLSIVPPGFGNVFSSHCIEHQPDLAAHLQAVERILRPGGRYFMMVPDKRYCFDHFLPASTLDGVLAAHRERRRVHTFASVHEHIALTTHNDAARHWAGDHEDPRAHLFHERAAKARADFEAAAGGYVDVHAWQFTPQALRAIVDGLAARKLTGLGVERVYDTIHGNVEFAAILQKPSAKAA
jgi:SAM-dependent methyltransferase